MKIQNWQTKALTLFIAALALWLTTACDNVSPEVDPFHNIENFTTHGSCGKDDWPREPSEEFRQFEGIENLFDGSKTVQIERALAVRAERLRPETERIQAILDKHIDQIQKRFVNQGMSIHEIGVGSVWLGEYITDKQVISIYVTGYADQHTLPPEDRIPECVDGVEVHISVSL